jgi:hypothetical protein
LQSAIATSPFDDAIAAHHLITISIMSDEEYTPKIVHKRSCPLSPGGAVDVA